MDREFPESQPLGSPSRGDGRPAWTGACRHDPRMAAIVAAGWNAMPEVEGAATVLDRPEFAYIAFQPFTDPQGRRRVRMTRVVTERPVRLTDAAGPYPPRLTYEAHEWHRHESTSLVLRRVDAAGRVTARVAPPLRKRLDGSGGLVVWDLEPAQAAACGSLLTLPALGEAGDALEVEWTEIQVIDPLDRDILVSRLPMVEPRIRFDAAAHPGVHLQVGDSPGLVREPHGWRLDRVLAPGDVLAVRIAAGAGRGLDPRVPAPADAARRDTPAAAVATDPLATRAKAR